MPEFVAYAKANPGALKMASTGNGSSPHVTGELFKLMTGLPLQVVHYGGGGPALRAMIAGEAQMMFEPMSASIEPVRGSKLRALAVTTAARSPALPDVPVLADAVPGFEASAVTGLAVPSGTPAEIVETLNRAVNAAFRRSGHEGKARRHRRRSAAGLGGRFRAPDGGGDREMGRCRQARRHQGRLAALAAKARFAGVGNI